MKSTLSSKKELRQIFPQLNIYNRSLEGHSLIYISELQQYMLYPGPFTSDKTQKNSFYFYNPQNKIFQLQETYNQIPSFKLNSLIVYYAPFVIVFSGQSLEQQIQNEIHSLNINTFQWKKFYVLDGPFNLIQMGFTQTHQGLLLMGGSNIMDNVICNDVWRLNLQNVNWNTQIDLKGADWSLLKFKNKVPYLKGHTLVSVNFENVLVFGGFDQKYKPQNTLYKMSISKNCIEEQYTKGKAPKPRGYHCMVMIRKPLMVMYGGSTIEDNHQLSILNDLYLYDYENLYWTQLHLGGYLSIGRAQFSMSFNSQQQEIMIIGGIGDNNVHFINELDNSTEYIIKEGSQFISRYRIE